MPPPTKGSAFRTQKDFAAWLKKNHATKTELWMRLFKVHARAKGIGYREALDESLCWGWIDGVRYALDDDSFTQRYSPRKTRSYWSAVNIKRYKELLADGRVAPAGAAAFAKWDGKKAPYSSENRATVLAPEFVKLFRANKKAWKFWETTLAPSYKRITTHYIMSAKRPETRLARAKYAVARCAKGLRIGLLVPKPK
jgi:uncharacterized protein YdeI (YjbR/CyaY-like superfamily)